MSMSCSRLSFPRRNRHSPLDVGQDQTGDHRTAVEFGKGSRHGLSHSILVLAAECELRLGNRSAALSSVMLPLASVRSTRSSTLYGQPVVDLTLGVLQK